MTDRRHDACGRAFPVKSNPNRPPLQSEPKPVARGETPAYPEKCNPCARRSPLTEDQRNLASKYLPLACAMVRRTRHSAMDREEMQSAAYVALVEAARLYDPSKRVGFATFARHRIRGALIDYRRASQGLSRSRTRIEPPIFRRISAHDETQCSILAVTTSSPDGYDTEEIEALESYFRRLPKAQASACRLIYLDGKSQEEAAALLGYSKAYLSRLHRDALESLSREYQDGPALRHTTRGETLN
ncbi:MAG: sigma-70 family RNA polymerase sigma factor [Isosphaeraceae bacterium]